MKKLRLNPEDLAIETFDVNVERDGDGGTIRAHQESNGGYLCATLPDGSGCLSGATCPECPYTQDPCAEATVFC